MTYLSIIIYGRQPAHGRSFLLQENKIPARIDKRGGHPP